MAGSALTQILMAITYMSTAGMAMGSLIGWRATLVARAFDAAYYRAVLDRLNGGPLEPEGPPPGAAIFRHRLYRVLGLLLVLASLLAGLSTYHMYATIGRVLGHRPIEPGPPPLRWATRALWVALSYVVLTRATRWKPPLAVPAAIFATLYAMGLWYALGALYWVATRA